MLRAPPSHLILTLEDVSLTLERIERAAESRREQRCVIPPVAQICPTKHERCRADCRCRATFCYHPVCLCRCRSRSNALDIPLAIHSALSPGKNSHIGPDARRRFNPVQRRSRVVTSADIWRGSDWNPESQPFIPEFEINQPAHLRSPPPVFQYRPGQGFFPSPVTAQMNADNTGAAAVASANVSSTNVWAQLESEMEARDDTESTPVSQTSIDDGLQRLVGSLRAVRLAARSSPLTAALQSPPKRRGGESVLNLPFRLAQTPTDSAVVTHRETHRPDQQREQDASDNASSTPEPPRISPRTSSRRFRSRPAFL